MVTATNKNKNAPKPVNRIPTLKMSKLAIIFAIVIIVSP